MKVLVTGGSGYIGSRLIPKLLGKGHDVTSIDLQAPHPSVYESHFNNGEFVFHQFDCVNPETWDINFESFHIVIPLAAVVGRIQCDQDPIRAREVNTTAIIRLLQKLTNEQFVIFPQTNMGFIPDIQQKSTKFDDNSILKRISVYNKTKIDAEKYVLKRPNVTSLRLSSVFGVSPRMKDHLLLNYLVRQAVQEGHVKLFEPDARRAFVSLTDLTDFICFVIDNFDVFDGKTVNVSDPRLNISKQEILQLIRKKLDFEIEVFAGMDPDRRNYEITSTIVENSDFFYNSDLDEEFYNLALYYRNNFSQE